MVAQIQAPLDKQLAMSLRQVKLCPVLCLICWLFHSQLSKLTHISKQVPCCCVFPTKVEYTQKQDHAGCCLFLWVALGCVFLIAVLQFCGSVLLCRVFLFVIFWVGFLVSWLYLLCSIFSVALYLVSEVLRKRQHCALRAKPKSHT